MPMDARAAIGKGLDLYRGAMRDFIRETLQVEYGESWFSTQVAPLLYGKDWRLERSLKAVLKQGRSAEAQIDIGEFARVIQEFGDLFPEPIRRGQHHHSRLSEIAEVRNIHVHATRTLYKADAETVLGACKEVLSLCGRMSAAEEIDDLIRSLGPPLQRDELGRVADSTGMGDIATKAQAAPGPTRKFRHTDLVSSRLRAGFLVGLLIGGLVAIAFLVLQRDDSAVGSTQEQIRIGGALLPNDEGGIVQRELTITPPTALVRGRIVVRIEDRAAGDYRIEFGFAPEWAMKDTETPTVDPAWFPTLRFLSESRIESAEDRDKHRWLQSSTFEIPVDAAAHSDGDGAGTVRGRVIVRYAPDLEGRGRLEFGFVPEWAFARSALGDLQDVAARYGILPRQRFFPISETSILIRLDGWLSSSVIEVPES